MTSPVSRPSRVIDLTPAPLTPAASVAVGFLAVAGGIAVHLLVGRFAISVIFALVVRQSLPMILGLTGERRRAAVVLNAALLVLLLMPLLIAYNLPALQAWWPWG